MKYTLGLDIGISSVGFGLIDTENQKIIESGVRLFSAGNSEKTQQRREKRGARRSNRRKAHRLDNIKKLLNQHDFSQGNASIKNPYEIRVRGLHEKLERDELFSALYHLGKRRGISYLEDAELDATSGSDYSAALSVNEELIKTYYPCEIQLDRLNTYGKVRGTVKAQGADGETVSLINVFTLGAYRNEAIAILKTQQAFYPEITDDFISSYIHLLERKREYYQGPGSEHCRTDYGIYRTNGETWKDLFEYLIGECSLCEGEQRASKFSKTAQKYNLLNDLNNLTINGSKLTTEQKEEIYKELIIPNKRNEAFKIITKVAGCKIDDIQGCRMTKANKKDIHAMNDYRKFRGHLIRNAEFDVETMSDADFDEMAKWLTLNATPSVIRSTLKENLKGIKLNDTIIDEIIQFRKANTASFSGWHSFSVAGINLLLEELWNTSDNQAQIITRLGLANTRKIEYKGKKLPIEKIVEGITNPIVRTSTREALKIVEEIKNKYGVLDKVAIELPRDLNDVNEKAKIEKAQKENEAFKKLVVKAARAEFKFSDSVYEKQRDFNLKLRLWYQQAGECLYSGKPIAVKDLVMNPHYFEIDHIIPKSISFDDSINNKVLCYAIENQKKGQRAPYAYFSSPSASRSYAEFKQDVLKLATLKERKLTPQKQELLLLEEDLNKYETRLAFKNRNLVDTRYASRYVLNTLQDFFNANEIPTTVSVVRGKQTANLRKRWGLSKDRGEDFRHHALDALLVAAIPHLALFKNEKAINQEATFILDDKTGELLSPCSSADYNKKMYNYPYSDFKDQLEASVLNCKFSHKQDSKVNRELFDETVYGVSKGVELIKDSEGKNVFVKNEHSEKRHKIVKIKNIYEDLATTGGNKESAFMKQLNKNKTAFLMYHNDRKTFEQIEEALAKYDDSVQNKILAYYQEHGPFRKYCKKGQGAPIYSMKYYEDAIGSHIEVFNNQPNCSPGVKLRLNPWRGDVYYNRETQKYTLVGLKYTDARFQKDTGQYAITLEDYQKILEKSKINLSLEEIQAFTTDKTYKPKQSPFVFCFSLYKNNYFSLQLKGADKAETYRMLSVNIDGRLKHKPIFKEERESVTSLSKVEKLIKYSVTPTGERFEIHREKLKFNF